jgi:hypothetical protein
MIAYGTLTRPNYIHKTKTKYLQSLGAIRDNNIEQFRKEKVNFCSRITCGERMKISDNNEFKIL